VGGDCVTDRFVVDCIDCTLHTPIQVSRGLFVHAIVKFLVQVLLWISPGVISNLSGIRPFHPA